MSPTDQLAHGRTVDSSEYSCEYRFEPPKELSSSDPEVLRAALMRESLERRRAECSAGMQTEVVQLALDLLVREPDTEGFFGGLARTIVEESESDTCAVWLLDETTQRCEKWLAYVKGRLFTTPKAAEAQCAGVGANKVRFPSGCMAAHLFEYEPGWHQTIEYSADDPRLPVAVRAFAIEMGWQSTVVTPMRLGNRTLGWITVCGDRPSSSESNWSRVVLVEAIARQAALALHYSRVVEQNKIEERRKAILEERNRLARDIHDNLAQGFAAILMLLQGAQREHGAPPATVAATVNTVVELARTHLAEARRSVGTLRPNVGEGEDMVTALKRLTQLSRRTTTVPIDLHVDELPRFGVGVEREIVAIAQEALINAVRHSSAAKITIRAATVQSVGLRLSVADDGHGFSGESSASGFGLTSMQQRAERIGASLTIVTAPRNGTEIVLAWHPTTLPTQVHGVA